MREAMAFWREDEKGKGRMEDMVWAEDLDGDGGGEVARTRSASQQFRKRSSRAPNIPTALPPTNSRLSSHRQSHDQSPTPSH